MPNKNIYYNYMSIDNAMKVLKNKTLKLSNPSKFNDLFDCKSYDFNEIIDAGNIVKQGHNDFLEIIKEECDRELFKKIEEEFNNCDDVKKFTNNLKVFLDGYKKIYQKAHILCLCEKPNKNLMWAHYAKNHTGVVLEFDLSELGNNFFCNFGKINYTEAITKDINEFFKNEYNAINLDLCKEWLEDNTLASYADYQRLQTFLNNADILQKKRNFVRKLFDIHIFSKEKDWSYENELRYIYVHENPSSKPKFIGFNQEQNFRTLKFNFGLQLKRIIFGVRTSDTDKGNIYDLVKDENVSLVTIKERHNDLFLDDNNFYNPQ